MWITTKDGRKVDTDWFDKDRQIEASKAEADERNNNKFFEPQTFKLIKSAYGKTTYESESFRIYKYSHNPAGTSWKESGYELEMKKHRTWPYERQYFNSLKEAKEWLNTEEAQEWYKRNRKEN